MPFGIDFWTNFGRLGVPKWSQVGTKIGAKIDVNFDWRFFKNHCFSVRKTKVFVIQRVEVGSQKRPKIDPKTKSKMDCILASIFDRFWRIWAAKLGPKIEPRSV